MKPGIEPNQRSSPSWWWREENNVWDHDPDTHTTTAKQSWTNTREEEGPIRVRPFVQQGEEKFRSILAMEPWKGPVEWSAHAYELVRRTDRDKLWKPYPDLTLEEQYFLMETLGGPEDASFWKRSSGGESSAPGYSDAFRWNLMAHGDAELCAAFERWLRMQRHLKHLPEPKTDQNRRGTDPSWLWPELLDLQASETPRIPPEQRVTLERARAHAAELASQFRAALQHTSTQGLHWPGLPRHEPEASLV